MARRHTPSKVIPTLDPCRTLNAVMALSAEETRIIARHCATPGFCLLCGTHPALQPLLFVPEPGDSEAFGGKPGKFRVIGYHLCRECVALPDSDERVKLRLLAAYAERRKMLLR